MNYILLALWSLVAIVCFGGLAFGGTLIALGITRVLRLLA